MRDPDFAARAARVLGLYQRIWQGRELGADEYVIKPFNPLLLVEVIKMVLDRSYEERLERRKKQKEKLEVLRSLSRPRQEPAT